MSHMKHSAHDRCDRCHAQSYVTWTTADGRDLMFCGHHHNLYEVALIEQGFALDVDDTPELAAMHGARRDAASAV